MTKTPLITVKIEVADELNGHVNELFYELVAEEINRHMANPEVIERLALAFKEKTKDV